MCVTSTSVVGGRCPPPWVVSLATPSALALQPSLLHPHCLRYFPSPIHSKLSQDIHFPCFSLVGVDKRLEAASRGREGALEVSQSVCDGSALCAFFFDCLNGDAECLGSDSIRGAL